MAASIPTAVPTQVVAGDTAKWQISLSDYSPADGWVLSYAFLKFETGEQIAITATTSGSDFLVSVAATVTQTWPAGEYSGQAYVTKAATSERYKVWQGVLEVLPNYVNAGQIDTRSRARKILDFIDASFEKLVQQQTVSAKIEGVELVFRDLEDLRKARDYWAAIVVGEDAVLTGRGRRCSLAVFTKPR
jgi:hypothetical protein